MPSCLLSLTPTRGREHAELRHTRVRRPDLLTVDAPAAVDLGRLRGQRRKVGTRVGLAESLTPDDRAGRDGGKVEGLLLVGAERHDRGTHPIETHVLRAARLVVCPHLLADDGLIPDRAAAPAVLDGPGEGEELLGRESRAEPLRDLQILGVVGERAEEVGGDLGGDERSQLGAGSASALAPKSKSITGPNPGSTDRGGKA